MNLISADVIFLGDGSLTTDKVIEYDGTGTIIQLHNKESIPKDLIQFYKGGICPGFVNTHCHLELSHMKGLVDTGTSLLPFLQKVVQFRDFPPEKINQAIIDGDKEMHQNGIVAVGDISNKIDTAITKSKSSISYYSFVEMFDFMQSFMTPGTIDNYSLVHTGQSDDGLNKKSFVPHAPYTVSKELFEFINKSNSLGTVSIHNQETTEENKLFIDKTGAFIDFYNGFNFSLENFNPIGKPSIFYAMKHMDPDQKTIMVHNTTSSESDIIAAQTWSKNIYWATCPNANLYIENRLPNYRNFINTIAKVTIGTDSLTSNWQLNIASEMLTIQKYCSYVDLLTLTKWACLNGAEALGYEDNYGVIAPGKSPGINLLNVKMVNGKYHLQSDQVKKII